MTLKISLSLSSLLAAFIFLQIGAVYCDGKHKTSKDAKHKISKDAADPCTAGEMRVSEGTFKDGFLDYCFDGEWGIVCGDNWDSDNAEVACRQLGFKPSKNPSDTEYIERPDDTPKYLRLIDCGGTEAQLSECPYLEGGTSNTGRWCNWSTYNSGMWKYQLAKVRCKEPLTCADPDAPDNGDVVIGGNDVGDTATYTCDTGYNRVGAEVATCTEAADGESASFTPDTPVCEIIVTCDNPEKPDNGGVTVSGNDIGSTATYTCNTGYELKGDDEATCTEADDGNSASFKPNPPVCKEILMCDTPDDPENGDVTVTGNNIGNTATYTCDTGYELKGDDEATCTEAADGNSASFKPNPPVCKEIPTCDTPDDPENGGVTVSGNDIGSTATYTCDTGYELKGDDEATCTEADDGNSASFKPDAPVCEKIPTCADPDKPENGGFTVTGNNIGDKATYTCNIGYDMKGDDEATCTEGKKGRDPTWQPSRVPKCKEIKVRCDKPKIPDDGDVDFDGLRVGNIANYTCRRGYKPIGEVTAKCTVNADGRTASFKPAEPPVCNITCDADAEGVVRLAGGPNRVEGRVEICMKGEFGTICDKNWGPREARTVCGEVSRRMKAKEVAGGKYEEGTGPIYFTNFMCEGTENSILECPHEEVVKINKQCNHSMEAGAVCTPKEN